MDVCQQIEKKLGRPETRTVNSPRQVDLDILLFGSEIVKETDLTIPHKRMLERDFVIKPLAEVAGEWIIPGLEKKVTDVAREFD